MKTEKKEAVIIELYEKVTSKSSAQPGAPELPPFLKEFYRQFEGVYKVFTDYKFNLYSLIIHGDFALASYFITGNRGPLLEMLPRETKIIISGIDVFRLDDSRIIGYLNLSHQVKIAPAVIEGVLV